MPIVVGDQGTAGIDRTAHHETRAAAAQYEGLVIAVAGLGAGVRLQAHSEGGFQEVGGLGGIADGPDQGVPAQDGEGVGGGVVIDQSDQSAEILGLLSSNLDAHVSRKSSCDQLSNIGAFS